MKLIVGLGNPGFRYKYSRHNIGFMAADRLAADHGIRLKKRLYDSFAGRCRISGEEVILAKPFTYMNLSGGAVRAIKEGEGISPEDMLIVMDDADLPLGKIRLREKGSSGGHKGLGSIIKELETEEVPRLRIGIASCSRGSGSMLSDYVLAPFKRSERKELTLAIEKSCMCIETWIKDGTGAAMNHFNT